jgi:hypothetical protein
MLFLRSIGAAYYYGPLTQPARGRFIGRQSKALESARRDDENGTTFRPDGLESAPVRAGKQEYP